MRIIVLQHLESDHIGMLRDCLSENDLEWDVVIFEKGQMIPELDAYDSMWVMGGPTNVWDMLKSIHG
jgi:GMP synthase - Glutamine amidotransferase domain